MVKGKNQTVFDHLGIKPVINGCGIYTDLGGSMLSPAIWQAMTEANRYFTRMPDLLDASGRRIAELMGSRAARITPGASAAIALSVAATMTGEDGTKWEQLPDTRDMKREVLMFRSQLPHYKYASCVRMPGCEIVPIGDDSGIDAGAIPEAVGARTACVMVPQHLTDGYRHPPESLRAICTAAHAAGVPVVVDAAYLNYPLDLFRSFTEAGADLVCFSAKYFYGPNAGGFVAGREDLVRAVAGLDFTRFESGQYRTFGRPFKMGRYEVIAVVLALEEWFNQDHAARWRSYARRVERLKEAVAERADVSATARFFTMDERLEPDPVNCLVLELAGRSSWTTARLAAELAAGAPSIATIPMEERLIIAVDAMTDEHADAIAERLSGLLR